MTQVGAYVLHVYCDAPDCPRRDPEDPRWTSGTPEEVAEETAGAARRELRRRGWKLRGARRDVDLCPDCADRREDAG